MKIKSWGQKKKSSSLPTLKTYFRPKNSIPKKWIFLEFGGDRMNRRFFCAER